jgi:DNA-binding response OmpR family regulator
MSGRRKIHILCVSRSTSQLELMQSQFPQDFEVIPASSPEEAVAFCAANEVTAIVLDSEFITEDGWTIAQSFRMVKPRLPIVLVKSGADRQVPPQVDAIASSVDLVLGTLKILLRKAGIEPDAHTAVQSTLYPKPPVMKKLSSSDKAIKAAARARLDPQEK